MDMAREKPKAIRVSRADAVYEVALLLESLQDRLERGAKREAIARDIGRVAKYLREELN